jgi:hypothetical protein
MDSNGGMILTEETEVLAENPVLVPLHLTHISNGPTWDRTRALCVMPRPRTKIIGTSTLRAQTDVHKDGINILITKD